MGTAEIILVLLVLFPMVALLVVAPIVGIRRAARRTREGRHSMAAVVWSVLNVAWMLASSVYSIVHESGSGTFVFSVMVMALNGTWLVSAIQANRAASRMSGHSASAS